MGEFTDKVSGLANEAIGKVKSTLGDANHDPDMATEGDAQQVKGDAQQVKGDVKGGIKNAVDKV